MEAVGDKAYNFARICRNYLLNRNIANQEGLGAEAVANGAESPTGGDQIEDYEECFGADGFALLGNHIQNGSSGGGSMLLTKQVATALIRENQLTGYPQYNHPYEGPALFFGFRYENDGDTDISRRMRDIFFSGNQSFFRNRAIWFGYAIGDQPVLTIFPPLERIVVQEDQYHDLFEGENGPPVGSDDIVKVAGPFISHLPDSCDPPNDDECKIRGIHVRPNSLIHTLRASDGLPLHTGLDHAEWSDSLPGTIDILPPNNYVTYVEQQGLQDPIISHAALSLVSGALDPDDVAIKSLQQPQFGCALEQGDYDPLFRAFTGMGVKTGVWEPGPVGRRYGQINMYACNIPVFDCPVDLQLTYGLASDDTMTRKLFVIRNSEWLTGGLQMADEVFWFDDKNYLRIKTDAPASRNDGTPIPRQIEHVSKIADPKTATLKDIEDKVNELITAMEAVRYLEPIEQNVCL